MRAERNGERGAGWLKSLIVLLFFVSAGFCAYRIIPPYMDNYQLEDAMKTEARFAIVNRKSEEDVRSDVFRKIQDLGIPARKDDIKVENTGVVLRITVNYAVPVDLSVYQFTLHFHSIADNQSI